MAKKEAEQSFGNDDVYIEKYLANPRHIEVQVIGDGSGNLIHIGERFYKSIQRRNQKIIEECPSPGISDKERLEICSLNNRFNEKNKLFQCWYLYISVQ